MRKLFLSLLSLTLCMLMLCSCVYYPDTTSEIVTTKENNSDTSDKKLNLMDGEIVPKGNTANIMRPMSGMSDAQAEEMRSKILNSKDELNITGTKYYVSSKNGDDSNDGLTPETAWATTNAISVNAWNMKAGDAVLFERGCVFRLSSQIFCKNGVTYGAYGEGEKPMLYGSVENYSKAGYWSPSTKENVWKLNLPLLDAGIVVFNHGEANGYKQAGLMTLTKNGDFYHNSTDNILYLYLDKGRPNQVYEDIEIGTKCAIFTLNSGTSDVVIDNICMKYTGNFGVQAIGFHDNIVITNCEIGWVGGSYQTDGLTNRYGNGIQFWDSASNVAVDNCWVYQCYDTGITFQGSHYAVYDNVKFINNLLEYNTMSIEFWNHKREWFHTDPDGDMRNIDISGNICRFAGYGWGDQRYNPSVTCHIAGGSGYDYFISSMDISNNIFDLSTHALIIWGYDSFSKKDSDIKLSGNTYYQSSGKTENILSLPGYGWLSANNQSAFNSIVSKIESSPKEVKWID